MEAFSGQVLGAPLKPRKKTLSRISLGTRGISCLCLRKRIYRLGYDWGCKLVHNLSNEKMRLDKKLQMEWLFQSIWCLLYMGFRTLEPDRDVIKH